MDLKKLIKFEDDKYINVIRVIELIVSKTGSDYETVIEYLGKFCTTSNNDLEVYMKGFWNEYSSDFTLSELLINDDSENFPLHTFDEIKNFKEIREAYFLKKDIFESSYIKKLNLNLTQLNMPNTSTNSQISNSQIELSTENVQLKQRIAELEQQLKQAQSNQLEPQAKTNVSNILIANVNKKAIKQFNRSLADALIELDYKSQLSKGDIVNFIMPHMDNLALQLALLHNPVNLVK